LAEPGFETQVRLKFRENSGHDVKLMI